jgi:hypothetical protein
MTDAVLRVGKLTMTQLIGVKTIPGCLFHNQASFSSHGFVELSIESVRVILPVHILASVGFDTVMLLRHGLGIFARGCGPDEEEMWKWTNDLKQDAPTCTHQ